MLELFKSLIGVSPQVDLKEKLERGAVIIDVRSKQEYAVGHVKGSINIPLPELRNHFSKLKKEVAIITCCASGNRSETARNLLASAGFEVYNGGGWSNLHRKIA